MYKNIYDFISRNWGITEQIYTEEKGDVIALPFPYNSPCGGNGFKAFFYWDTYFACRGLLAQNFYQMAENNLKNFIYEVNRFGFIPNMNRVFSLNRSQVPFFGALIELFIPYKKDDKTFLAEMAKALEEELKFWTENRCFENGLFHYGSNSSNEGKINFYDKIAVPRIGCNPNITEKEKIKQAEAFLAEAESGWDFTPRFEQKCNQMAAIDLNSLICKDYKGLSNLYKLLGNNDLELAYLDKFNNLKETIQKVFWNETRGGFFDFCPETNEFSQIFSCAGLFPLFCEIATKEQAEKSLQLMEKVLECNFGLAACEKTENSAQNLQWDYPNAWPPLQFIAIEGLDNYDFSDKAKILAKKYLDTVTCNFSKNNQLYEKYNAVSGKLDVVDEYPMPPMFGWSAGTFVYCYNYLGK